MRRLTDAILGGPSNAELPELQTYQRHAISVVTLLALTVGVAANLSGWLLGVFAPLPTLLLLGVWCAVFVTIRKLSDTPWGGRHPEHLFFALGVAVIAFISVTPWQSAARDLQQAQLVICAPLLIACLSHWRPMLTLALGVVASVATLGVELLVVGHLDASALQRVPVCFVVCCVGAAGNVTVRTVWRDKEISRLRLAASDRMSNLGRMTAGLAHELKTPIAATDSSLRIADDLVDELERSIGDERVEEADLREIARELHESVRTAARTNVRVADFVRAIRTQTSFERSHAHSRFSVAERVGPIERLLAHELRRAGIELRVNVETDAFVLGDPGRVDQVLTNLIQNASNAIAESGIGGTIRVDIGTDENGVTIAVEDDGPGVPHRVRDRIFDYLFTTRPTAGGTGIGLALCRDIVVGEFGGSLALVDVAGRRGARFELTLRDSPAPAVATAFEPAQGYRLGGASSEMPTPS